MKLTKKVTTVLSAAAIGGASFGVIVAVAGPTAASATVPSYKVIEKTYVVASGTTLVVDLRCPTAYVPVGGGAHYGSGGWPNGASASGAYVAQSDLDVSHRGWASTLAVTAPIGDSSFTADVVCILK